MVSVLKRTCKLNETLKNENVMLRTSLMLEISERKEKIKEINKSLNEKIRVLGNKNEELQIINEKINNEIEAIAIRKNELERINDELINKNKLIEIENFDLKLKNSIYTGLDKKLEDKNFELKVYEYKLNDKIKEVDQLKESVRRKEDKILELVIKKPNRHVFMKIISISNTVSTELKELHRQVYKRF